MYAPTTLVPARDFWQYCFFLPLAACSRVLLLLLLSCHETCKCSFCFCVLLLLSSWISQEFYPVVWWMNWTCWDLINGKLLWLALRSVENELNIFCTSQILSFTRAGILSYMPKCVYVADLIYWIYSLCLEGWSGLLLAAVAAAEQQQAAQPEAAAEGGEAPNAARDRHPAGRAHPGGLTGAGGRGLGEGSPGD